MKLYIKQKVWSWKDRFTVKDPDGHDRYAVEGEFSVWRKLHVYDAQGAEVIRIEQKHWTMMPCFLVYIGGQQAAEVKQKFSWTSPIPPTSCWPWPWCWRSIVLCPFRTATEKREPVSIRYGLAFLYVDDHCLDSVRAASRCWDFSCA